MGRNEAVAALTGFEQSRWPVFLFVRCSRMLRRQVSLCLTLRPTALPPTPERDDGLYRPHALLLETQMSWKGQSKLATAFQVTVIQRVETVLDRWFAKPAYTPDPTSHWHSVGAPFRRLHRLGVRRKGFQTDTIRRVGIYISISHLHFR